MERLLNDYTDQVMRHRLFGQAFDALDNDASCMITIVNANGKAVAVNADDLRLRYHIQALLSQERDACRTEATRIMIELKQALNHMSI